ncbi:MAG TPA: hypothetical protein VMU66_04970 [Gaiellales bacterium]|nr:hypothetical protein [Gaiellales bacterium]
MSSSLFNSAIEEHLELKRRNRHLDADLPLDEFLGDDPFENHPLFKSEEQARREEDETGERPAIPMTLESDTERMPVVEAEPEEARGWMETTTAGEFSWD